MSEQKTSITAYGVICGLEKLARQPRWRDYFSAEAARLNAAFMRHGADTPFKRLLAGLPPAAFIRLFDAVFIPGMVHHFLFRKRLVEACMTNAIAQGAQQIIVLGAGLDTLAVRSAVHFADTAFFEIDLPDTQRAKHGVLSGIGHNVPANCHFIAADLGKQTLEAALAANPHFSPAAPTLVILEGVLMYLTEAQVKALFAAMHMLFTGSLSVVFGAMAASDNEGNWRVRWFNAILHRHQEATQWYCPGVDIPSFMARLGYTLTAWMPYRRLQTCYRMEAELRGVPAEDENYYIATKSPVGCVPSLGEINFIAVQP
jgi:methyltransferase (TIGR00027 family)